jgi:4-amino-4-deoxy-L-arabinose transferase-like glycosyltransferase
VFFCFWLALSTYLTVLAKSEGGAPRALCAGFSWGLALVTRFSAIALFPFALLYLVFPRGRRAALGTLATVALAALVALSPWVVRNYTHTGRVFVSNHGSLELWYGYNEETFDIIKNDISVDQMKGNIEGKLPELSSIRKKDAPDIVKEAEESSVFVKHAVRFAVRRPVESITMMPTKLWKFWSWRLNPRLEESGSPLLRAFPYVYTASYLPVLLLGALGVFLTRRSWREHCVLLLLFLGYSLLHMVVYGFTRLRLPLDQFVMVYAACALVSIFHRTAGAPGPGASAGAGSSDNG